MHDKGNYHLLISLLGALVGIAFFAWMVVGGLVGGRFSGARGMNIDKYEQPLLYWATITACAIAVSVLLSIAGKMAGRLVVDWWSAP